MIRSHGLVGRDVVERFGFVSRMDVLQAAILEFRLSKLSEVIEKRRKNAALYYQHINTKYFYIPPERDEEFNTYHTFIIQCDDRDKLRTYLFGHGIETFSHYPIPIHLQRAAVSLGYQRGDFPISETQSNRILSLPIHQYLREDQMTYICKILNNFFE